MRWPTSLAVEKDENCDEFDNRRGRDAMMGVEDPVFEATKNPLFAGDGDRSLTSLA